MDTLYFPFLYRDADGELLFSIGGHTDAPQTPGDGTDPLTFPGRFVDKIYCSLPNGSGWHSPRQVIGKHTFPWMNDEAFLAAHPESFIGSVASPSVFRIGDTLHMLFSASVSDPNCCTGEHGTPNLHGSCDTPWSYFAIFWATSTDRRNWTLRNMGRDHPNIALQHAVAYHEPTAEDAAGGYKGAAAVHAVEWNGTIEAIFEFWSRTGQKNGVLRIADQERVYLWRGGTTWSLCPNGALADWFVGDAWTGNPFAHIISGISRTALFPGYEFILTAQGAGQDHGKRGRNNCIEVAFSKGDLTQWEGSRLVETGIATLNGAGADNCCLNPVYVEDGDGRHFLFATNDEDQDGRPDCNAGPYPGLAIYRGDETLSPRRKRRAASKA